MLLSVWSPKGGAGTSVVCVAMAALIAATQHDVRLVDFGEDGASIVGARLDNPIGITDWLRAGPSTPANALDSLTLDVGERFRYIPRGTAARDALHHHGATTALVNAMRASAVLYIADCQTASEPTHAKLVRRADLSIAVVRPCFLTLRRSATQHELLATTAGLVFVDEPHRSLGTTDFANIVGRPILATVPIAPAIARSIDAGVLLRQRPGALFDPLQRMCERLGLRESDRRRSA